MDDPRKSEDPLLLAAISAWDNLNPNSAEGFAAAMALRTSLRDSTSHEAFAWASLTCGRIASCVDQIETAELMLAEAMGRFDLIENEYGHTLASACVSTPQVLRHNLDRALVLALRPFSSGLSFRIADELLLHSLATHCYSERNEYQSALAHLMKGFALTSDPSARLDRSKILTNVGYVLEKLGECELGIHVAKAALSLFAPGEMPPPALFANLTFMHCQAGRYVESLPYAEAMFNQMADPNTTGTWVCFETMSDAFAFNGFIEKAEYCLERSRALKGAAAINTYSINVTRVSEAILFEAKQEFATAISIAREILGQFRNNESPTLQRYAARILARCYKAKNQPGESVKWARFADEVGRDQLLGPVLSMQLRANFSLDQSPVRPLTDMELTCLSLSARGQSSADIGLKLGIKKRTVNFHFSNILRKLNALNRQEAISKAIGANLLRPG